MRRILLALVSFLIFASPAVADYGAQTTTLLDSAGQPVSGQWQTWIDQSKEITYEGDMTLDVGTQPTCLGGYVSIACTGMGFTPGTDPTVPETAFNLSVLPSYEANTFSAEQVEQMTLLYEQGHVVDTKYLSDAERAMLMADWGVTVPSGESIDTFWWQGMNGQDQPVMGEWFSAAYAICAYYGRGITWQQVAYVGGLLLPMQQSAVVNGLPILRVAKPPVSETETAADAAALHAQLATCALIGTLV